MFCYLAQIITNLNLIIKLCEPHLSGRLDSNQRSLHPKCSGLPTFLLPEFLFYFSIQSYFNTFFSYEKPYFIPKFFFFFHIHFFSAESRILEIHPFYRTTLLAGGDNTLIVLLSILCPQEESNSHVS